MDVNVIEIKFVLYSNKGYEDLLLNNSLEIKVTTVFMKKFICLTYQEFINLFKNINFNTDFIKFPKIKETDLVYFRINNRYKLNYCDLIKRIPSILVKKHHISIVYGVKRTNDKDRPFEYGLRYGNNSGFFEHNEKGYSYLQLYPSDYINLKKNITYNKYKIFGIDYSLFNYHYCIAYKDDKWSSIITLTYERILHGKKTTFYQCSDKNYTMIIRKLKIKKLYEDD